jgi:hypothetical protein
MKTCKCSTLPTAGFLSFLTTEVRELARILRPKVRLLARRLFLSGRGGRYGRGGRGGRGAIFSGRVVAAAATVAAGEARRGERGNEGS